MISARRGVRAGWGVATVVLSLLIVAGGCGDDDSGGGSDRLRILVTNDDGVSAEGIDVLVEALSADADNEVVVVAPDRNHSGRGDQTGPSDTCGNLSVVAATTLSGHLATAVNGCPADAVKHALAEIYPPGTQPHLLVAGINEGQNVSVFAATQLSGTVGAAKTAARRGVPALAVSQGNPVVGGVYDYPSAVEAVQAWIDERRHDLLAGTAMPSDVDSINVPSCDSGAIRGTLRDVPLAADSDGFFISQDCTSTLVDPRDDIEALNNGFIAQSKVPLE